jgi:AraC-like DNA-binding protein
MSAGRTLVQRVESPLGSWLHALRWPGPELAGEVAMLWFGDGSMSYSRDRILPRGCLHLLINLGPRQYLIEDGERIAFDDFWLSGTQERYLDTEAPAGACLLGIAFHPGGAWPFLPMPQQALRGYNGSVAALLGDGALALRERLLQERELDARFDCVEQWLRARRLARHARHAVVAQALATLQTGAPVRVATLARDCGVSERRLGQLFEREVGLGPKAFARLMRFHACLAALRAPSGRSWCELAAGLGYADQAHMSREMRAFAGYAPGELLARPAPDAMTVVVA